MRAAFAEFDGLWCKLDAGTEAYFQLVDGTRLPFHRILDNLLLVARERPIVVQSLFLTLDGVGPDDAEIAAWADRLREITVQGGRIDHVQVYTVARAPSYSTLRAPRSRAPRGDRRRRSVRRPRRRRLRESSRARDLTQANFAELLEIACKAPLAHQPARRGRFRFDHRLQARARPVPRLSQRARVVEPHAGHSPASVRAFVRVTGSKRKRRASRRSSTGHTAVTDGSACTVSHYHKGGTASAGEQLRPLTARRKRVRLLRVLVLLFLLPVLIVTTTAAPAKAPAFEPGAVWLDTDGRPIQAHGGGMLFDRGVYYWFGENKDAPNTDRRRPCSGASTPSASPATRRGTSSTGSTRASSSRRSRATRRTTCTRAASSSGPRSSSTRRRRST